MEKQTLKWLAIAAIIIAVGGITVGYAALQQVLEITSTTKVQSSNSTWNVHFEEAAGVEASPVTTGEAIAGNMNLQTTTITIDEIVLKVNGDSVTYYFKVVNDGQVPAELSTITEKTPQLSGDNTFTSLPNTYTYNLTYKDGRTINEGDTIEPSNEEELKLVLSLDTEILPKNDVIITGLGYTLTYIQGN